MISSRQQKTSIPQGSSTNLIRLSISHRMIIGFGSVLILIILLGFIVLNQFGKVDRATDLLTERNLPFQLYSLDLATTMDEQKAALIRYLVDGDEAMKTAYEQAEHRVEEIVSSLHILSDNEDEDNMITKIDNTMDILDKQGEYVILLDKQVDENYYKISEAVDEIDDLLDKEVGPYIDVLIGYERQQLEEIAGELEIGIQESLLALAEYIMLKGNKESKEEYEEAERNLQLWQENFIIIAKTPNEIKWSKLLNENMDKITGQADKLIINFDQRAMEYSKYSKLEANADQIIESTLLTHGAQVVSLNTSSINKVSDSAISLIIISLLICSFIAILAALLITRSIILPVRGLQKSISMLSLGRIPDFNFNRSNDEIGDMTNVLMSFAQDQESKAHFAEQIGEGNYNSEYNVISEDDLLGNGLLKMRHNLKNAHEEDQKRYWANEGYTKIAQLMRSDQSEITELTDKVITNMVEYLKANQGAIYILNEKVGKVPKMKLMSYYAWSRKKFLKESVEKGEGLIGQCWREEKSIYLTDVPKDFVKITSGLGNANPRSILITPLKSNDKVYGILEIASFHELDEHQINFVEKVTENMASTFSSIQTNFKTKRLLERAQMQGEELRIQEEEMRQSQEELQTIQEDMEEQKRELEIEVANLKKQTQIQTKVLRVKEEEIRQKQEEIKVVQSQTKKSERKLEKEIRDLKKQLAPSFQE